ncbi:MAG: FAD-dependent oxidoreductase, partial [Pseudomonadota bacterium]
NPCALADSKTEHVPVLIVGAGPVGLCAAVDLALHGIKSILIDDDDKLSTGSRAICWAKRTLEIFDRLGIADSLVEKGITWKVGRLFHGDTEVYSFDLLPETGHKMPAFINLPQYHVEDALVTRIGDFAGLADICWKNKLAGIAQDNNGVTATIETPDGPYQITADYVLACDGSHSTVRKLMNLEFSGEAFEEKFLIADIVMEADFPSERWFWFDPPFHRGHSVLLHKQPDNLYRIDFKLGRDADPDIEKNSAQVRHRVEAMLPGRKFELDWLSVYSFQCRRLKKFVHDRVIFAGDAAHLVSPFGARGGNGGIQDVDNLVWKLSAVLKGVAPATLLQSYDEERIPAADENTLHSTRATRFLTPRTKMETILQNAVLRLAKDNVFARKLVNSGRLSTPCIAASSSLQTPASGTLVVPGTPCPDAPLADGWLLNKLDGQFSTLGTNHIDAGFPHIRLDNEIAKQRYGEGLIYLIRPDQHVAAVFSNNDEAAIHAAHQRALGKKE